MASPHDDLIDAMARAAAVADSGPEGSALFDGHWGAFGDGYLSSMQTALTALREKGYAVVPVEPSDEMIEAGDIANPTEWTPDTDEGFGADVANDVYRAMLAAAPVRTKR